MNIFGFAGIFTGFKPGKFAIEINTRFTDGFEAYYEMIVNNLMKGNKLTCWENRKMLENFDSYDQIK